jgi:hypothetical protein
MLFIKTYFRKQPGSRMGLVILFAIVAVYTALILQVQHNYLPVWSDEFFYYTNAASYFENNTPHAALTFSGAGSNFLGADAHGFAYPLLNGSIAKIFGWHSLNFLYTNCFFVLISLAVLVVQKNTSISDKIWTAVFILLFPFFTLYGFTFMQESIHIFFAVASSFLILNIYKTGKLKYFILFILLVFIAGMFRPLWFFWLIGLLPFAKNKLQGYIFALLFITGVAASFLYTHYLAEAVPNYFSSLLNLFAESKIKDGFFSLVKHFVTNVYFYFFSTENIWVYLPFKYFIFTAFTFFAVKAFKYKTKLYIAITLIGGLNFGLLFFLYDVFGWREIRVLAPFFYFCIPYLVTEIKGHFKYIFLASITVLFIFALPISAQWIENRNIHSRDEIVKHRNAYNLIAQKAEKNSVILINYIPSDDSLDLINLPVKNISGDPIRYIVPYYNLKKEKYGYVLSEPSVLPVGMLLISTKYYRLEKISE